MGLYSEPVVSPKTLTTSPGWKEEWESTRAKLDDGITALSAGICLSNRECAREKHRCSTLASSLAKENAVIEVEVDDSEKEAINSRVHANAFWLKHCYAPRMNYEAIP